jgi:hypothetical protein
MRTRIARKLLYAALAVVCLAPGLWAQKKAGQVTRQIQPAQVQRSQAAAAAARPAGAGGIAPKITPVAATDKMPIYWEDKLVTGDGGRMRAQLEDGSILSLGQKSELLVREHNARTQQSSFQLGYGQVRAQVVKLSRPDSKFEIRTNTAICGVLGTDEYIEATTPFSTLVVNMSDPNSRSQVEVRNSDPRVTGMVVLNPGQATVVDQGKPPAGARQASGSEVNRGQQETTAGDQPVATPVLQVTSGTVSPGETPTARIEAGAQLTLDARLSTAGAGSLSRFQWQIPRRNFQSSEPMLVVSTNDWAPGSYEGSLTVTTAQNKTASARFTIVIAASLAGRSAPDDAIQALARAYESLQVSQFLSYFDQQNYSGYASLEQTINQSFANIAENRVLVRKANGQVSGDSAVYQVEFEIRFLPKNSALPQSGVPGMSPSASAPPMLVPMRSGVRAAAVSSISGSTGAVATYVTLTGLTTPMTLFVNTGAGTAYTFKDLPVGRYVLTPSRNGFTFSPASRTVELPENGLTEVDFTATGLTQVVRETVTVQLQYIPNASWHIRNLSGPMGSAGLVGVPGVGKPDAGGGGGGGSGNVAIADFDVTAAPQNLPPIARGGGGTPVTVTINPLNGFTGTVTVSWTAGAGITVTPATQAVAVTSGPATQTFTVSAGANAALGNTGIQFLAASGNIKKQGANTVTVYGLTVSQIGGAVNIFAGGFTAQLQIKVDTAPTITTPITVSASGPGITSSAATVNGNGTASLTLTSSGPDTGATTVTVTASGAGIPSATLAVPVTRVAPFTLSGGGAVSFVAGDKGSVSFGVTLAPGFSGPVVVTAPAIGALSFAPTSVTLTSSGTATFSVTAAAEFTGTGTFTATAGSYSATGSASFSVQPALEFTVTGGSIAVMAGQSGAVSVNITQTKGTPVQFSASVSGVSGSISVSGGGSVMGGGTVTFTVNVPQGTAAGTASFTVQVTGGTITRTVTVAVSITAQPPVAFSLSGGSITLAAGASGTVSVSVSQTSGPTAAISVSVGSFDSSKISVSGGGTVSGSGSVTFQVTAAPGLPDTSASFTVIASSGTVTQTATVGVSITSIADFTISGGSVSVMAGGPPVPVSVQVSQTVGIPLPISVSASTITGPIAVSGGGSVTGTGSVTFNVTAPASAAAGSASFEVVGNLAGITHSATVSVTIQSQPEFTIGGASITLLAGASGTVSIPVKQTSGAPVSISVTATGVDSRQLAVSGGGSVTGEGTVTFSVTALATASAGPASFTVVASYGSITRSATVTVTIDRFTLAGPGSLSVPEGGDGTVTLTLAPASFAGNVSIATTASSGLTVSGPASVSAAGGTYTIAAGAGAPDGTVAFTATSGSMTGSITVNVSVLDAVESASASGGSSFPTGTVSIEVAVGRATGYLGPVVVDAGNAAANISVSPSSVTVPAGQSTATFSATIASGATTGGTVSFTAHIPGSSRQKSATASIAVVPPFSLGGGGGLTVMPGDTASASVSVQFASGFTGPVSVSASGGAGSITTSPSSLTSSGSVSIRVNVPASATPGSSTITVTASGAGITQTATIGLTIGVPPPAAPAPGSIQVVSGSGQSAPAGAAVANPLVVQVNSTTGNAFPGATVTFAVSPAGAARLSSTTATTGSDGKASVTLTMGSTPGDITVTATVTGVTGSATFSLTVTPATGISLSLAQASMTLWAGSPAGHGLVVTITRTNYTGAVTLSVSGLPTGVTATITDPGLANFGVIDLVVSPGAPLVTDQTITVTASGSGVSPATATFSLTVSPAPAISVSLGTSSLTLTAGGASQTISVAVTRSPILQGGLVYLSVAGLPTGVSATITHPGTGDTGSVLLQASAGAALITAQTVTISASQTGVSPATATFSLTVAALPAISLSIGSPSATLTAGGISQMVTVTITRTNYIGAVTLSVTGLPTGVTATSIDAGTGDTGSFRLEASAGATLVTGQTITITGSGNGVSSVSTTFTLTVLAAPAISLSASAPSVTLTAGGISQTVTVTVTRTNYTGAVTMNVTGLPTGVTPTSTDPGAGDTGSLRLQASAGATLVTGQTITITGSGSGVSSASTTFTLTVVAAPAISLSASAPSATLTAGGGSQTVGVTLTRTNYTGAVTMSVTGLPTGVTAASTDPGTGDTGSLRLQASAGATLVTGQTITITASGTGVSSASTTFTLTVVAGPAISLSAGTPPVTVTLTPGGGSQTVGVTLTRTNFTGAVALTVTGLPTGVTATSTDPGTGDTGSLRLQASAGATLVTGQTITITASGTGVSSASTTFTLTVMAGAPATLTVVSGTPQSGTVGQALASPLVAKVADSYGNPVPSVAVSFQVTAGTATLSAASANTASNGQAQVTVTLGTTAGAVTVTASVSGIATPVTFSLTVLAGVPAALTVVSGTPQSGTVGTVLASPLVVKVADSYGNPVPSQAVSFLVTAGGGALGAVSVMTAANGQAQTTWIPGAAGTNTVSAWVPAFPSIPAVTFTASAVPPAGIVSIGSGQGSPGAYASVPVNINFAYPADGLSFSVMVSPVGGAPALTGTGNFSFTPGGGVPNPTLTDTGARPDTISLSFLNVSPALTGVMVLGQLRIKVPFTAAAGQSYIVQVTGGSANLGQTLSIPVQAGTPGTLTVNASAPPTGGGMVSAGSVSGPPGTLVQVPITLSLSGATADTVSFSFTIVPGGSGLPMSTALSFVPQVPSPPVPTINASIPSLISVAWLSPLISPPLSVSVPLGNVRFTIPTSGVAAGQTYTLRITSASATSSGASLSMVPGPDATLSITLPPSDMQAMSRSAKVELDIPADELTYTPSFPREGDTVKFRVRVRNGGRGDARDAELALLARDRVIASQHLDISAGRSATVELAWKAEAAAAGDLRFTLRTAGQPDSGRPEDNPPAVTLRLRNFAVERRGGLSSLRRERFTVDVRNEGCSGLRLLTGSQTSCGGSADIEFSAFINENGRIVLQAFANDGGLIDLGVQPLASVAAAPGAGYLPQGILESGRTYAVKARNRYALVRIARIVSSVNPRLLADERKRNDNRRRDGRVIDEDPFQGARDTRTLDRVLDSARISIQIEYLVQEDGSVNFQ